MESRKRPPPRPPRTCRPLCSPCSVPSEDWTDSTNPIPIITQLTNGRMRTPWPWPAWRRRWRRVAIPRDARQRQTCRQPRTAQATSTGQPQLTKLTKPTEPSRRARRLARFRWVRDVEPPVGLGGLRRPSTAPQLDLGQHLDLGPHLAPPEAPSASPEARDRLCTCAWAGGAHVHGQAVHMHR